MQRDGIMEISLESVLKYEQPTKYIVNSENYSDTFSMPVLTAGKSFVLGYTDEKDGICRASENPVIIFDDFMANCKYVDFDFKVKSSAMKILHKVNENDNLRYYFYAMRAIDYTPFSHKRVWISEYSKLKIKNRSVVEQNKITADLDNVVNAISNANERLNSLDELIQSRFVEMFGDTESNSNNYPIQKLSDLCTVSSSKRIYQNQQASSGVPFLRISNLVELIETGHFGSELFISDERYDKLFKNGLVPKAGDILVTSRGTLGKCYIVQNNDRFYFQDGMISWLYHLDGSITPLYLTMLFNTRDIKRQIDALQSGSTVAYLSITMLKKLNIVVPPLALQNEFADFVKLIDESKIIVQKQINNLQELLDSKMDKYFG